MSIFIDSRIGSKHLQPLIPGSELAQLESADCCWMAANGKLIGVEVKRLADAVQCLYTGRLADHQIPKMREQYDYCYLVVEGVWRPEPGTGVLQQWREFDSTKEVKCGRWQDVTSGRKRLMYSAFSMWLETICVMGGVSLRLTPNQSSTAATVLSLYNWWQRSGHASYDVLHQHEGTGAVLSRPTMMRRMLALLPHVGWDRSAVLARRFPSIRAAVEAGRDKWYIKGQIAAKSAQDIVEALNGNK